MLAVGHQTAVVVVVRLLVRFFLLFLHVLHDEVTEHALLHLIVESLLQKFKLMFRTLGTGSPILLSGLHLVVFFVLAMDRERTGKNASSLGVVFVTSFLYGRVHVL